MQDFYLKNFNKNISILPDFDKRQEMTNFVDPIIINTRQR